MQRGLMTEYEWRQAIQCVTKARPDWWGAQCIYPRKKRKWRCSRSFRLSLVIISLIAAVLLQLHFSPQPQEVFADYVPAAVTPVEPRKVSAISYQLPLGMVYHKQAFPREQLLRGSMLLIDQEHPLPDELLPPNTVSIAQYSAGMVPVRSLKIRSGYKIIDALEKLFDKVRSAGAKSLSVYRGTISSAQQQQALVQKTREYMQMYPPEEAIQRSVALYEWPGTSSLLLENTVEIGTFDGSALEATKDGQALLQLCWREGFVRESAHMPFRFRYVGKAHATAMTYLDLNLPEYLQWLHQKGILTVSAGGKLQYLILCQPIHNGYATFDLPECEQIELSMDNTGYALAACTF